MPRATRGVHWYTTESWTRTTSHTVLMAINHRLRARMEANGTPWDSSPSRRLFVGLVMDFVGDVVVVDVEVVIVVPVVGGLP